MALVSATIINVRDGKPLVYICERINRRDVLISQLEQILRNPI
jgi:hypothetical protein